jgi:hypothetical protein
LMIVCGLLAGGIRRGCLGAGAPVSGAPGAPGDTLPRPAWRRPGRAERGRIRAGGELVELWPVGSRGVALPPSGLVAPSRTGQGLRPTGRATGGVRDRSSSTLPLPLSRADWHDLCQGGAPPPAFRTDVRSGGGIPNPALTHPSDNAGANPLTKGRFQ